MKPFCHIRFLVISLLFTVFTTNYAFGQEFRGWDTNFKKKSINLSELKSGGPPKDGIPSIDNPVFITQEEAAGWIEPAEPVIAFAHQGKARAYPLQILIWHEIVNDKIGDIPILVTFCPLCYSAIVFDRRIKNETHDFGVSGFLRHSDMIMFDRTTESLWQQFTGDAIVGDYTGRELKILPSQIISFEQFRKTYPDGFVLSKKTGYKRAYGQNPYAGYDDINNTPFLMDDIEDDRLPPMEKVIGVRVSETQKAYPYSLTKESVVINDNIEQTPVVVFHTEGALSALDASEISKSREDGSTGAFLRTVNKQVLEFTYRSGEIIDTRTNSTWDISGKAIEGKLKGEQLEPLIFGDYFAFAWLVFWPDTELFQQ